MLLKYAVYTALLTLLPVSLLVACSNSQAPTPTTSQARSTCQTSQLQLAVSGGDAGMSQQVAQFSFQNTSNATCTLFGYPDIQILNNDHHAISTQATHSESGYLFEPVALKIVSLKPAAKAYFVIDWEVASCTNPPLGTFLQATPPGQTSALTVSAGIDACGGVGVSPVSNTDILNRASSSGG